MVPAFVLEQLASVASAPIYSHVDSYVGRGVVGGRVISFENEGKNSARLALRILAGEKPESIGVQKTSENKYLFDARQLQRWGISGVQKETVLASARAIVTVEEVVDVLEHRAGAIVLPHWALDAVSLAPGGAHPSYAHGYYDRDNEFYVAWDGISRERDTFEAWMKRHVLDTADVTEYRRVLDEAGVAA